MIRATNCVVKIKSSQSWSLSKGLWIDELCWRLLFLRHAQIRQSPITAANTMAMTSSVDSVMWINMISVDDTLHK